MKVERIDDGHVRMTFEVEEGNRLARLINAHARDMPNGCLELSSLLEEAWYGARNHFRQPHHAFDEHAPRAPSTKA
ncbi:hypothetical protein [Thioalkalivibrio sulfidiphilus]|uniref:hypothetical protein n=1 Tax=Thioalkalivibrio sulfidiphilus TaxID=1033854 RepID=UPI003B2D8A62